MDGHGGAGRLQPRGAPEIVEGPSGPQAFHAAAAITCLPAECYCLVSRTRAYIRYCPVTCVTQCQNAGSAPHATDGGGAAAGGRAFQ